jgi:hypothetical protein
VPEELQQPVEGGGREVGGGAAAEEEGLDGVRSREFGEFPGECGEVAVDQVIAVGDEGEVAVSAAVPAEGDMHIRRTGRAIWRQPRRRHLGGGRRGNERRSWRHCDGV